MFRSKRSTLVRELWKLRITQNDSESQNEKEASESKSVLHSMLKRLKEKNLEILLQSVESKGREQTPCVLLPNVELKMGKHTTDPHILCCQVWRWPDLTLDTTLRQLPCCETDKDPLYVCCNPHHWSIQQTAESSYCADKANSLTSGIDWPSDISMETVSTETGLTPSCRKHFDGDISDSSVGEDCGSGMSDHWCSVAYWELRQRVGRLYIVHEPYLNIFQDLPHGNGFSLGLVQGKTDVDCVKRTREKIGLGLVLSREADGVWLYNRSNFPVFVNSPTLDNPSSRTSVVIKVNPGYSMNIFNYDMASVFSAVKERSCLDGPYDPTSIRISFAKGWGPSYHRQFITSCPAWLEVLLNVNR
ncbi:mothers against decapentaplegic homolog 6-like [Saccostrea cucullata]|uniref:mothers against decapentaplegic homolog 6-like n=1 Tax=Saccostrea cuccullata TaxID=36930 RepID=UPI002ED18207